MINYKALLISVFSSLIVMMLVSTTHAQDNKVQEQELLIFRETPQKINDLIHTKLDVRFDYKKRFLFGKEWVTLKPHIYPTDSLRLDAKGMDLKEISVLQNGHKSHLKFTYDSLTVLIHLDKTYRNNEKYTIYIEYTAKPDQLKVKGSAAISDAKGLYFINPDGKEKDKPIQIWTQGETESSSAWFPTIDKPSQKTTEEISITVLSKYVTLSNGRLASKKVNADGTRTDTWIMDLPHSPYLFMMAVGDFKIYKDTWHGKEVSYYLEPAYAPYAKDIFGMTPELIDFYSKTLGVDYPWNKYSQIVVRDYVSGAMENTSATLHGEYVQASPRELIDANYSAGRSTIAHELFHQWFGDYVTAENWSNLTVNESFADFSEMLWAEHKYGQDEADAHSFMAMTRYLRNSKASTKNLVRYHYADKEDVFDVVTYQKGGRILNMLRNYLGKEAFFKGLSIYLKTNALKNAGAQQLRLAFEEASGKDLNWFFNQWYFGAGHPVLSIRYNWDEAKKIETVYLNQSQGGQPFILPFKVDLYLKNKVEHHNEWMRSIGDTLIYHVDSKPDLVNVDADKILLVKKSDKKTQEELFAQYTKAPLYLDRREALDSAKGENKWGQKIIIAALKDNYYELRIKAIKLLELRKDSSKLVSLLILRQIAQNDSNTLVRAAAITSLGKLKSAGDMYLFKKALSSQSYSIQGAALLAINVQDPAQAMQLAKAFEADNKGQLSQSMGIVYATSGGDEQWDFVYKLFNSSIPNMKFNLLDPFSEMISKTNKPEYAVQGINSLKEFGMKFKNQGAAEFLKEFFAKIITGRQMRNDKSSAQLAEASIKEIAETK